VKPCNKKKREKKIKIKRKKTKKKNKKAKKQKKKKQKKKPQKTIASTPGELLPSPDPEWKATTRALGLPIRGGAYWCLTGEKIGARGPRLWMTGGVVEHASGDCSRDDRIPSARGMPGSAAILRA